MQFSTRIWPRFASKICNFPAYKVGSFTGPPTMDTAFRKIDIDAYDEDACLESELFEPDPRSPAQVLSDAKQKQTTVKSSLTK